MVIRSLLPISLETTHDPKEPVLLIAFLRIMRHAKLCLSVIMLLICVCCGTQKGCAGHCLLVGRGVKFDLLRDFRVLGRPKYNITMYNISAG